MDTAVTGFHIGVTESILTNESAPRKRSRLNLRTKSQLAADIYQSILVIGSAFLFIYEAYRWKDKEFPDSIIKLEIVVGILLLIDVIIKFAQAPNKQLFWRKTETLLDVAAILPSFFMAIQEINMGWIRLIKLFRIVSLAHIHKLLLTEQDEEEDESTMNLFSSEEIERQVFSMAIKIMSLLLFGTGLVHYLSSRDPETFSTATGEALDFFTCFYYIVVTAFTVGYGDIYPLKWQSRFVVICIIMSFITVVTDQTSKISALMAKSSKYDKRYKNSNRHVIMTGAISGPSLLRFLTEFYHPDHGKQERHVLVVNNSEPADSLLAIIEGPLFTGKIDYIKGNLTKVDSMSKCKVKRCDAIFVLSDPYASNTQSSDAQAMLIAKAIEDYTDVTTYVQLIRPENLIHSCWVPWDLVFSVDMFKFGILATSADVPGFSAFVSNLLSSRSETDIVGFETAEHAWLLEYCHGAGQEVYAVPFSEHLIGRDFAEVCLLAYKHSQVCLLGVESDPRQFNDESTQSTDSIKTSSETEILINPVNYKLRKGDKGFFICGDAARAEIYGTLNPDVTVPHLTVKPPAFGKQKVDLQPVVKKWSCSIGGGKQRVFGWRESLSGKLSGHIIVCTSLDGFEHFVGPLRRRTDQPVVILDSANPSHLAHKLNWFSDVYFLQGSSLILADLHRVAADTADSIVILSKDEPGSHTRSDSNAMFTMCVADANFKCHTYAEMLYESNMKYMKARPTGKIENLPFYMWPQFANGHVFFASALDTLLCQTFYNRFLLNILSSFVRYNPNAEMAIEQNKKLNTFKAPKSFVGKTYGELYEALVSGVKPVIPLGIYRPANFLGSSLAYMYTNPHTESIIGLDDMLMVIGDTPWSRKSIALLDKIPSTVAPSPMENGSGSDRPLSPRPMEEIPTAAVAATDTKRSWLSSLVKGDATGDGTKQMIKRVSNDLGSVITLQEKIAAKDELVGKILQENHEMKQLLQQFITRDQIDRAVVKDIS
eukprot:GILK01013041.1.p1 GENE.GILK01013041.1~~GILK01013041.1.p1  ORF type:complete len:1028 (+),score=175.67 GILK01013041.1:105-3086(+)